MVWLTDKRHLTIARDPHISKKIKEKIKQANKQKIYFQNDAKSRQKERTKRDKKDNKTEDWKKKNEMKIKETWLGSYEELYITMASRILLGQNLKISVIVITVRNDKNYNRKNN